MSRGRGLRWRGPPVVAVRLRPVAAMVAARGPRTSDSCHVTAHPHTELSSHQTAETHECLDLAATEPCRHARLPSRCVCLWVLRHAPGGVHSAQASGRSARRGAAVYDLFYVSLRMR